MSRQLIGNTRTWAADEDSGEISASRVGPQNLQERAPLTLPNGGGQVLGGRRRNGCEKKKQSGDDAVHMLLHKLDMSEEIKGGDFEVLTPNTVHDRPFNASTNTVGSAEKYQAR